MRFENEKPNLSGLLLHARSHPRLEVFVPRFPPPSGELLTVGGEKEARVTRGHRGLKGNIQSPFADRSFEGRATSSGVDSDHLAASLKQSHRSERGLPQPGEVRLVARPHPNRPFTVARGGGLAPLACEALPSIGELKPTFAANRSLSIGKGELSVVDRSGEFPERISPLPPVARLGDFERAEGRVPASDERVFREHRARRDEQDEQGADAREPRARERNVKGHGPPFRG